MIETRLETHNPQPLAQVGVDLRGTQNTFDALERAGLARWNVRFDDPVGLSSGVTPDDGKRMVIRNRWGTDSALPTPTYVSMVGSGYHIVQNEEHAAFMDELLNVSGGHYETATEFRNGKLVYLSIKLPDHVMVGGADPVNMYLNAVNSHDGSTQFMVSLDPVRAWCSNQLSYFRKTAFKLKHTKSINGKVQAARQALAITLNGYEEFSKDAERLVDTDMRDHEFSQVVEELFPRPRHEDSPSQSSITQWENRVAGVHAARRSQANANIAETAWGGFNAVVEYLDWTKPIKGQGYATQLENRVERMLTSDSHTHLKERAHDAFMALS